MSELSKMSPQDLQTVVYGLEEQVDAKDAEIALLKARVEKLASALTVLSEVIYRFKSWDCYGHEILEMSWGNKTAANPAAFARKALDS